LLKFTSLASQMLCGKGSGLRVPISWNGCGEVAGGKFCVHSF